MRLQKLGHSCLLVEQARSRLLIDPGCFSSGFEAFAGLTAVLVTHVHQDHLDADRLHALLERNPEAEVACDEASAALLAERGVKGQVVHDGDVLDLGMPVVGYLVADRFFHHGDAFTVPDTPVGVLAVPASGAWMKLSEGVDHLRRVRLRVAVPVHDYQDVFAGMAYHVLERCGPAATTVTVLEAQRPTAV